MILIMGIDNYLNGSVAVQATTIVGALLGLVVLVLAMFLYINRKWCFNVTSKSHYCDENNLPSKYVQKIARKFPYEKFAFDSEEEVLRQSNIAQICDIQSEQHTMSDGMNRFSPSFHDLSFHALQHVTITPTDASKDPLGIAERGIVGIPYYNSECSSNESTELPVESKVGLLNGGKKSRKTKYSTLKSIEVKSSSIKETRIDNPSEKPLPINSTRCHLMPLQTRSSQDDVPDLHSNKQDCIVVVSQEPVFDTSDIKSLKSEIETRSQSPSSTSGRGGSIEISLLYDAPMRKMTIHVLQAKGIPSRHSGQQTHTQVRLLMLPTKKQKHKTRIRSGENPQFMESFLLHRVNPEEVNSMGLRIRIYGCERMRKERLIGEAVVSFAIIDLELETNVWLPLEPRSNSFIIDSTSDLLSLARSDSGSTTSMQHGGVPELLLGLAYSGTTGRLTIEIVKGSYFRNLILHKSPDTYVKLCLVNSIGQEMARAKSSTRRGQPNPLFKETFVFQVALFQLNDVTLMVSVYAKRNMKRNEMVGWFSLGLNSSGPDEMAHWVDMREAAKGELLTRWHVLVDS